MKKNQILTYVLTGIPALLVIMSGIFKLTGSPEIVDTLTKVGVAPFITALGVAELAFAALYLYPKTSKVGFLMLICYFSGAMATDLSHRAPITGSLFILVSLYIAGFFKNKSQFVPEQTKV